MSEGVKLALMGLASAWLIGAGTPAVWAQAPDVATHTDSNPASAATAKAVMADDAGSSVNTASPSPSIPRWQLRRGLPVHTQLQAWAEREGWVLDWKPRVSWLVAGDVTVEGSFEAALAEVIEGLFFEGKPVRLVLWQGNRLAEVVSSDAS